MGAPSTKRFTIRRRLGEGGMGVVYEAFDQERRAAVALKTLNRFDGNALARFKREFRALQGLAHPNLVALDELFFENDEWFFTMELLDGVDFVSHVRGTTPRIALQSTVRESVGKLAARAPVAESDTASETSFDEAKLRDGLRQLLEGLAALHAVDKVHRDIKPSNVMVTAEGRVVLLDFGLVTEAAVEDRSTGSAVVGTPAYMAPEQAASREVGPSADLYAVGVMLYEALTGRLPIDGAQLQILLAKQTREPAPPASIVEGIPKDLDSLCVKLLRFAPEARPSAADALRALAVPRPASSGADLKRSSTESPTFVGRGAELAELRAAHEVCLKGRLSTVLVCGESGIGKSYTVRRFTGQLVAERPESMLLEGRCYERETVPYKTLDGIVDALSRRLARMTPADVDALLPARSAVLAQVFPVLLRVPAIAKQHAALTLDVEPHELRQRAFAALRDLFTRVALRRATVIFIDDLQWADDDGLRALAEILRPPDAPPLLLLGTVRIGAGAEDAALARLRGALPGENRIIELASLGHEEARELAVALLRRTDAVDADPELIATEAGGHPLFVEELARHVALGGSARDDVKLDDAIWSRITQLEPVTRDMAELVAIAGKPVPQEVVAAAAHVEPGEFNRRAATLRVSNVVKTGGARWADAIEPYHDRVREAVLAQLEPERRRALHEALAIAFEASSHRDPETLATHWREGENAGRAAKYATVAGDQAASTFAFDRAAQWYEQALGLLPGRDPGRRELQIKLGDALGNGGRGVLAASHFESAAADSPPGEALELRRRAAEQLLRGGDFDRGTDAIRAVLASIGMRLPTTLFGTVIMLAFYRAILAVRGRRFREREKGLIPSDALTRIDTCIAVGMAFSMVDTMLAVVFTTRALLLALQAGEVERIAVLMGMEAAQVGVLGGVAAWRRAQWLLERGRPLADRSGSALTVPFMFVASGGALYGRGRFREAVVELDRCLESMKSTARGLVFEASTVRVMILFALVFLGRFKALRRAQEESLRDALARGDLYTSVSIRVASALVWLAEDRPDDADRHTTAALDEWSKSRFDRPQAYGLHARVQVRLYVGDYDGAYALASELLMKIRGGLLWRLQASRVRTFHAHAASAVAKLMRGSAEAKGLRAEAARSARALEREEMPWISAFAQLVRAAIALHGGSRDDALSRLDVAVHDFTAVDMLGYAAAARYHAACLRSDPAEKSRALDYFRSEDVVAPERMIRMLVPGFPE